jgi:hypothetical protein
MLPSNSAGPGFETRGVLCKENTENTTSPRNVLKRHFVSAKMSPQNNSLEYFFTTTPATIFGMSQTFYPFRNFAISLLYVLLGMSSYPFHRL